jgi:ABC-2 type transport system permease protein
MRDVYSIQFWALFRREFSRFVKVIAQTVITPFVSATLYLMIFGMSLGRSISTHAGLPYISFLIPGLVMMGCLNNAFQNSSSSIISSKFSGDLEDLKVAPLTLTQIVMALSLAALIRALMVGGITFLVGEFAYYWMFHEPLGIAHPAILLAFLILGSLTFACFGICIAFWARTFDQLSAVTGFILMPLIYLGGVFFSIETLPSFWRSVSLFNPLLYMINGVRYGILGQADVDPAISILVALVAFVAMLFLALRSLKYSSFQRW